ncbi:MAG: spore maturation protein [Myxococcota bacterium]|nr:spore maturation protein [Myxococcota bacterium]
MLNAIWLGLILASVVCAAFTGRMDATKLAAFEGAKSGVSIVLDLVGAMVLFLGLMRVAQDGGLLRAVARWLAPVLRRLFPDVPQDHPAMGAMIMNLASNVLGLGNAATPFGLKAMVELGKLNRTPGAASDSMALFLAINATSVALLPTGVIAIRAGLGSTMPDAIWGPTLLATSASTLTAIAMCLLLRRLPIFAPRATPETPANALDSATTVELPPLPAPRGPMSPVARATIAGFALLVVLALGRHLVQLDPDVPLSVALLDVLGSWFLPLFIAALLLIGLAGRVPVYERAVEGGREGLEVAIRIIPFLVMILTALAMLRASGALELMVSAIDPVTGRLGFPAEALPMALLRPLSGSGAYGVMVELMQTHGVDSFLGVLVGTMNGSTETTFYVLTLYLGAARIRDARYILFAALAGDLMAFVVATAACRWLFPELP